jgi:uncharacterized protein involved in cysteine biosynthesis
MKKVAGGFLLGFVSFFSGFSILFKNRSLWKFAAFPMVIAVVSFIFLFAKAAPAIFPLAMAKAQEWVPGLTSTSPATQKIANIFASSLITLLLFVGCAALSFILMRVLAGPINGFLAERTLSILGTLKQEPFAGRRWVLHFGRMLLVGLLTAVLFTIASIILFTVSFIPAVNLTAAFGLMLIATLEVSDYSFEALGMGLWPRFRYFFHNLRYFLGFATAMSLVFFIPGFSLVLFPVAVVGAAQLVAHIEARR